MPVFTACGFIYATVCGIAAIFSKGYRYQKVRVLIHDFIAGSLRKLASKLNRDLGRETQRNFELIVLTELLTPDFKTIADFRIASTSP